MGVERTGGTVDGGIHQTGDLLGSVDEAVHPRAATVTRRRRASDLVVRCDAASHGGSRLRDRTCTGVGGRRCSRRTDPDQRAYVGATPERTPSGWVEDRVEQVPGRAYRRGTVRRTAR